MLHTTLRLAKKAEDYQRSYRKFAKHIGNVEGFGEDTPIPLIDIIDVCGFDDAILCLICTVEESKKFSRLLACEFAEHVLQIFEKDYPGDKRPREAIAVARRFARGKATIGELSDAAYDGHTAGELARKAASAGAFWAAFAAEEAAKRFWQPKYEDNGVSMIAPIVDIVFSVRSTGWAAVVAVRAAAGAPGGSAVVVCDSGHGGDDAQTAGIAELEWQEKRFRELLGKTPG